jgi:hypothetical protein
MLNKYLKKVSNSEHDLLDYVEALALGSSIVCITESHLDDTILSRDIQIQGYHELTIKGAWVFRNIISQ